MLNVNVTGNLKKLKNLIQDDEEKVFKIKYTVNLLPSVNERDGYGTIISAFTDTSEINSLLNECVQSVVDYKWFRFAKKQQLIGFSFHIMYQIMLSAYIWNVYLKHHLDENGNEIPNVPLEANIPLLWVLGFFLAYPIYNDGNQMLKYGTSYFATIVNYVDIFQIFMGIYSIVNQILTNPENLRSKAIMIITIFTSLIKTFFYMRVVKEFSFIVTMLVNVIKDLLVFMLFFSILVVMFSMVFDIVAKTQANEYRMLHPFLGNLFTTLRLALGDFDFGALTDEGHPLNQR